MGRDAGAIGEDVRASGGKGYPLRRCSRSNYPRGSTTVAKLFAGLRAQAGDVVGRCVNQQMDKSI